VLEIHVSSGVQRGILHIWLHTDTQHALQRGTVNVSRCGRIPLGRCSCLDYAIGARSPSSSNVERSLPAA
jgi:hypothetical protein